MSSVQELFSTYYNIYRIELGHQGTGVASAAVDTQRNFEQFLFPSVSEFLSTKQMRIRLFSTRQ